MPKDVLAYQAQVSAAAYFHAVTAAAPDTIRDYLDQAFERGRTFDREPNTAPAPSAPHAGTPGEPGD